MLADDRQALVEGDVGLLVGPDRAGVALERARQQVADEPAALRAAGGSAEGLVQGRGIPVRVTPFLVAGRELGDERVVAAALPEVPRVREELVVAEDGGQRLAWVQSG